MDTLDTSQALQSVPKLLLRLYQVHNGLHRGLYVADQDSAHKVLHRQVKSIVIELVHHVLIKWSVGPT